MDGYLNSIYAKSLTEYGMAKLLIRCNGWILERKIPGFSNIDAMGCYPLFLCKDWSNLNSDLDELKDRLISLSVVTDPFGNYNIELLKECFKNVVIPFKQHFVINLNSNKIKNIPNHHRRNIKKANQNIIVETCDEPIVHLNEWLSLYNCLVQKHNIKGLRTFSRKAFENQLKVPGLLMFKAKYNEFTVGMILWYVINDIGYYHLAAYNELGYKLKASFALFDFSIQFFSNKIKWLNLGAGAGINSNSNDGLTRFKQGWANETKTSYFCGRIFNKKIYDEITDSRGYYGNEYFPIYRKGEFN